MYEDTYQSQHQPQPSTRANSGPGVKFQKRGPYFGRGYVGFIIAGVIILLAGGIIYIGAGYVDPGGYSDSSDFADTIRIIRTTGELVEYIGLIILSVGLILGAINDTSLPPNVRLGMLIVLGLVIGFKMFTFVTYAYGGFY